MSRTHSTYHAMQKFAEAIFWARWPLLFLVIGVTAWLSSCLFRIGIDPSVDSLFDQKQPEYIEYKSASAQYGSDQMIVIAMSASTIFEPASLEILQKISRGIDAMAGVERVMSLSEVSDLQHKMFGVKTVPLLEKFNHGEETIEELRERVLSNELFTQNLVSSDGKTASILVYLQSFRTDPKAQGLLIKRIKKFLANFQNPSTQFYLAGVPIEQYEFTKLIQHDQFVFVPMIIGLLVIALYIIFRSFSCVFLCMSIVLTALIWTIGTIALAGQSLNLVTSLLAPIVMVNAVANSIHIISAYFEIRPKQDTIRKAVTLTLEKMIVPCFLTNFTTALGFLALLWSPVPAIQSFGLFSALGTLYAYGAEILLPPLILQLLPHRSARELSKSQQMLRKTVIGFLENIEFVWKWAILAGSLIAVALSIWGISRLQVDTNLVKQMKSDSEIGKATRFIDNHLTGVYELGFVLSRKDRQPITDYQSLQEIDAFKEYLESIPHITKVNSVTTLLKRIHWARTDETEYSLTSDTSMLERYFKGLSESKAPQLKRLVSNDFREIRLEARMKAVGTHDGYIVEQSARDYLDQKLAGKYNYKLVGNVVLLGKMSKSLVSNQMSGFSFSLISILILIAIIFRSIYLGVIIIIPNLLPILMTYGLMGFCGIELSTPTAMISSVVLGMVVDASIFFLHHFKHEFKHRYHYVQALHHTYRGVGYPLLVSSSILIVGFASSAFASFRPTILFGVLTSVALFFSVISALLILPALLTIFQPLGRQKLFKRD